MGTSMAYAEEAKVPYKPRKVGFFKRKMQQWLRDDGADEPYPSPIGISTAREGNSFHQQVEDGLIEDGLSLTIHNANGGYVVSFRRYDRIKDRSNNSLYVISSEQKFEEALAQCIAMECLQR